MIDETNNIKSIINPGDVLMGPGLQAPMDRSKPCSYQAESEDRSYRCHLVMLPENQSEQEEREPVAQISDDTKSDVEETCTQNLPIPYLFHLHLAMLVTPVAKPLLHRV